VTGGVELGFTPRDPDHIIQFYFLKIVTYSFLFTFLIQKKSNIVKLDWNFKRNIEKKTVRTNVLVIRVCAAGSMAAIKVGDYTKNIIVLEKIVHRSSGALGIEHFASEVNLRRNVPGSPTSMEFVEGYMSSSSDWLSIERLLDKYIIAWDEEDNRPYIKYPDECQLCFICQVEYPAKAIKVKIPLAFW
jgi:NAD-dependent dihydropyrimidine dehydrogenase PreA subunit